MQDPTEAPASDLEGRFFLRSVDGASGHNSTIVLQNENGPCALVAIANNLILGDSPLASSIEASKVDRSIDEDALKAKLGEIASNRTEDPVVLSSLAEFLPKLTQGLDVNPRFDGSFQESPELRVFAAFGIPIVHGWVLGPMEREEFGIEDEKLSSLSYEEFCTMQFSDTPNEQLGLFAQRYQSQLTTSGYVHLLETVPSDSLSILFWNNHFSTLLKRDGQLLTLVTDLGYQNRPEIVWEVLEPSGAGQFLNGNFSFSDQQIKGDEALAKRLEMEQKAKHKRHAKSRASPAAGATSDSGTARTRGKRSDSSSAKESKSAGPSKKDKQGRCAIM